MSVALTPPTSNSSPQGGGGQRTAVPTLVTAPWSWDEAPVCSLFVLDNDPSLGYPSSRSATLPSRGAGEPDRRSRRASCPMRESRPRQGPRRARVGRGLAQGRGGGTPKMPPTGTPADGIGGGSAYPSSRRAAGRPSLPGTPVHRQPCPISSSRRPASRSSLHSHSGPHGLRDPRGVPQCRRIRISELADQRSTTAEGVPLAAQGFRDARTRTKAWVYARPGRGKLNNATGVLAWICDADGRWREWSRHA